MTDSLDNAVECYLANELVEKVCWYYCELAILYSFVFSSFFEYFGGWRKFNPISFKKNLQEIHPFLITYLPDSHHFVRIIVRTKYDDSIRDDFRNARCKMGKDLFFVGRLKKNLRFPG